MRLAAQIELQRTRRASATDLRVVAIALAGILLSFGFLLAPARSHAEPRSSAAAPKTGPALAAGALSARKGVGNARKRIGRNGGLLRARGGAALYVPPGTLRRRATVSIKALRGGRIDFHIAARWTGNVAVTMPRVRRGSVVGHRIGNVWLPEGKPGQRTVWVSRLSRFDTIKAKAKAAACFLTLSRRKLIECLISKLGKHVSKDVARWIADKLGGSCAAVLATSITPLGVALAAFNDPACVGKAGEGEFHFPTGPSKTPSVGNQPPTVTPPRPPTAATYPETTGGPTNTWTNYTNAGGYQGPTIPAFTTVRIACKLPGFRVADGNTWWYRIAQSPWNSAYYASADAFYNNGQTSGSLVGTPFVDPSVPSC